MTSQPLQTVTYFPQISGTPMRSPHGHVSPQLSSSTLPLPAPAWLVLLYHATFHKSSVPRMPGRGTCTPLPPLDGWSSIAAQLTTRPCFDLCSCIAPRLPLLVVSDCHLRSGPSLCADLVPPWLNQVTLVTKPQSVDRLPSASAISLPRQPSSTICHSRARGFHPPSLLPARMVLQHHCLPCPQLHQPGFSTPL